MAGRQLDAGVHFLVPCGTTGETPTLSAAEKRRVVEIVVAVSAGRAPVLAGANALTPILEDQLNGSGTPVAALLAGHVTDADAGALLMGFGATLAQNTKAPDVRKKTSTPKPATKFDYASDAEVLRESQEQALEMAKGLLEKAAVGPHRANPHAFGQQRQCGCVSHLRKSPGNAGLSCQGAAVAA